MPIRPPSCGFRRCIAASQRTAPATVAAAGCPPALSACSSTPQPTAESIPASATASVSLLDRQLFQAIELERALDEAAAQPDAIEGDVQRQFQEVAQLYRGILARNPDSLYARLLFAKLLSRFGDADGAREQFLLAARLDPNLAVIHQELSTYYAESGDPTRALAYALNAVRIDPQTAAYQFNLGQVLTAYRSFYLEQAIFSEDQLDGEILRAFRTARDLAPQQLDLQFRFGEAFYDLASPDWRAALAQWDSLLLREDLLPVQIEAIHLHRARCLLALGRPDEAAQAASLVSNPDLIPSKDTLLPPSLPPQQPPHP